MNGVVHGFYIVATDVTARRLAEKSLAETARRLHAITDNIPALITHIDADQRYLFVNSQVGRVFKKDVRTMLGRRVAEEHPPERYALMQPHIEAALAGERVQYEGVVKFDNEERFFQTDYIPDLTDCGKVCGFFAMTFDITSRRKSQRRRAENEKRLRTITDNVPALIGYIDSQQRLQFCNIHYRTTFNFDIADIIGKKLIEVYDEKMYEQMAPYVEIALT